MTTLSFYGASDDLVEVEGDFREEYPLGQRSAILEVSAKGDSQPEGPWETRIGVFVDYIGSYGSWIVAPCWVHEADTDRPLSAEEIEAWGFTYSDNERGSPVLHLNFECDSFHVRVIHGRDAHNNEVEDGRVVD